MSEHELTYSFIIRVPEDEALAFKAKFDPFLHDIILPQIKRKTEEIEIRLSEQKVNEGVTK